MKKLVNLSPQNIEIVWRVAKTMASPQAIRGDFGKALNKIIEEWNKQNTKIL